MPLTLEFEGRLVRIESEDTSHLQWLEEFLSPHFRVRNDGPWNFRIRLKCDKNRYDASLLDLSDSPSPIDAFVLDSTVVRLPSWKTDQTSRTILDEKAQIIFLVNMDRSEIQILARKNHLSLRTHVMRVIRELVTAFHSAETLILHASCALVGNHPFVIAGPKCAGKTTLLIYLMQHDSARYVTNDRLLLRVSSLEVTALGIPTIINLRESLFELFPSFFERFSSAGYHFFHTFEETAVKQPKVLPWKGSYSVSPAQLCALLKVPPCRGRRGPSFTFLFPRINKKVAGIKLRQTPPREVVHRIEENILGHRNNAANSIFSQEPLQEKNRFQVRALSRKLTSRAACFDCELGHDSYKLPQHQFVELLRRKSFQAQD